MLGKIKCVTNRTFLFVDNHQTIIVAVISIMIVFCQLLAMLDCFSFCVKDIMTLCGLILASAQLCVVVFIDRVTYKSKIRRYVCDYGKWGHVEDGVLFYEGNINCNCKIVVTVEDDNVLHFKDVKGYNIILRDFPISVELWKELKGLSSSWDSSISRIIVKVFYKSIRVYEFEAAKILLKGYPTLNDENIYYLPRVLENKCTKSEIEGLFSFSICKLLYYTNAFNCCYNEKNKKCESHDKNVTILDFLNYDYLENRDNYSETHKDIFYAEI